jgi:hypothetical protein
MTMSTRTWKRTATGLIAGAAAALMIGATVAPAFAVVRTWSVSPGGKATSKAGTTFLKDTKTGITLKCTSSKATVVLKKGHRLSGTAIGEITAVSFSNCVGPADIHFSVASNHLPWKLNALSYNAKTQTTTGTITGIHATLAGKPCSASVDGTGIKKDNGAVVVTYSNKTHRLTVQPKGGNLHVYSPSAGCLGLIRNGDPSQFTTVYTVTPGQKITSP